MIYNIYIYIYIYIHIYTYINFLCHVQNDQHEKQSLKVWKKPKYNSWRNECLGLVCFCFLMVCLRNKRNFNFDTVYYVKPVRS